jgi:benzoyl-CoA reductase/2-hydroxyglutaryl-CoA dehydratase subunit BcrC/BadD/HgdB
MKHQEKLRFKADVLQRYNAMMRELYLEYREHPQAVVRISALKVMQDHVAIKTCEALKRKVRPSTKIKAEVRKRIQEQWQDIDLNVPQPARVYNN